MADLSNLALVRTSWAIVVRADVGPFASPGADAWTIQWKRKSQSWAQAEAAEQYYQVTNTEVLAAPAQRDIYSITFCNVLLDVRVQQTGVSNYDWHEVEWTEGLSEAGAQTTNAALNKRTLTYKEVRDMLVDRYFSATPSVTEMARIAQFITSANREAMEKLAWAEADIGVTVSVVDGLVTWADVQGADYYKFWTVNPWADSTRSSAMEINVLRPVADGIYLETNRTEVFVHLQRRAPVFSSVEIVAEDDYTIADVRFDPVTGHCYECLETGALGSALSDGTQWRALPILWSLVEPILNFAEAHFFARSQERGQSGDLRRMAENQLEDIAFRKTLRQ